MGEAILQVQELQTDNRTLQAKLKEAFAVQPAGADSAEVARLNGLGDRLRDRLNAVAAAEDRPFVATGYGSMVGLHFTRGPVRRSSDSPAAPELRALLHHHLLEHGYSYARRGFVALSLPIEAADVDGFAGATEAFLAEHL